MANIFIAGKIPQHGLDLLTEHHVDMYTGEDLISEEELAEKVRGADALLSLLSTPVTEKVLQNAPNLKIVANFGAGFDNIHVEAATKKGIHASNTPKVSTEATAELTFALLLAAARRIPEGDTLCRTVGFKGWAPLFFLGREVYGKTIGIIGLGNIGKAVARRAKGFGMNVLYHNRTRQSEAIEKELGATYASLEELLQQSDFVTINCSYQPSMRHMISTDQLHMMKPTAYLINASRGPIVEEKALIEALREKKIEGAALDVFEFEPKIGDELKELKNVVLAPHIGNATIETRDAMAEVAANNILEVLKGNNPITPVNNVQ